LTIGLSWDSRKQPPDWPGKLTDFGHGVAGAGVQPAQSLAP
jgi:hypothetical protein